MRKKYYHRKLVRDKIPEWIKSIGGEYETRILEEEDFEQAILGLIDEYWSHPDIENPNFMFFLSC